MTELQWSRSHGDSDPVETLTIPRSGDPPAVAAAAAGPGAGEAAAVDGGVTAAKTPPLEPWEQSAWELLVEPEGACQPQDLADLVRVLDESPELRSAALLRSLERARDVLERLPGHSPADTPVELYAGDVLSMLRSLLSRLR